MGGRHPSTGKISLPGPVLSGLALALLVSLFALRATADWLVTVDGTQIETQGPWEVKGKLILLTLPGGALSSIRLADIDLDASEHLSAAGREVATRVEPKREPREAVVVLTDADVSHVGSRFPGSIEERQQTGAEARERARQTASAAGEGLTVDRWDQSFDDSIEGLLVTGSLENRSDALHTDITL